jgi:hypothetical protein
MSSTVKYPQEPQYEATVTVTNNEGLLEDKTPQHGCAKCFMGVLSLIFIVLGVGMISLACYALLGFDFGDKSLLGESEDAAIALLVVGSILLVVSVIVWVASCKPTAACSKIILVLFGIVMMSTFIVELAFIIVTAAFGHLINIPENVINTTGGFADVVTQIDDVCCNNVTADANDVCKQVFGDDLQSDCADPLTFYNTILKAITPVISWIIGISAVVAFFNLFAFVCSCCLLCSKKRSAYYKPAVTYQSGV